MVQHAFAKGVKPAARRFHTSPPVVRKWLHRFKTDGYSGLEDLSHKPHHSPNETPRHVKDHVVALKAIYKRVGAEQVRILEKLTLAPKTIRKIWKEAKIPSRKRPKKHVTKNNLRAVKNRMSERPAMPQSADSREKVYVLTKIVAILLFSGESGLGNSGS